MNLVGDPLIPPSIYLTKKPRLNSGASSLSGMIMLSGPLTSYYTDVPTVSTRSESKIVRRTRLYLMDGTSVDTPLTMFQIESFIQSAGRQNTTPFLRTIGIDKSGKLHSTLISYGFLARADDLESYS